MSIMKSIRTSLLATAICTGVAFAAAPVSAQEAPGNEETLASVMIVDYAGIMREASAMQDARKQVRERQLTYKQEIDTRQQAIRDEEQQLAQQRSLLAPEAYQQKQKEFQQKFAEFQKFAQSRSRILDQALGTAQGEFSKQLNDVIAQVAEERGATLVLHQGQVILFANQMNASKEVFDLINAQVPTMTVTFEENADG
ncbi:OmpH family outer membrane protein [Thalassospira sp. MA62]|nr:OmpH family outer membrane protein [Thalassospira sp. MA62]